MATKTKGHVTSKLLRAWRSKQPRGAIMKPSTFKSIEEKSGGGEKGKRIAGAAYWATAKKKFKARKKR